MILALGVLAIAAFAVNAGGPSPDQLAKDIAEVDAEIKEATATAALYGEGSVLRLQIDLRANVLKTTRAMLNQKRRSWLRGIDLGYQVAGRPVEPASAAEIKEIEAAIADANSAMAKAQAKADLYSGGLVQVMALVEVQTQAARKAIEQQRLALARIGMALPTTGTQPRKPPPPTGQTIDEKGAL
jgi:hypothetical protein